ncbi:hypothetical protein KIM372_08280 [Bombiscardovia nodaiensis]|uniref:Enolpyruvate transferase domain-containing protein n=1 Tax=Bombiscardovia nodaiensis TaxID=2932181 RepID=A0ABM8B7S9_9BIFI|nr:hypothetical protein KIM372_08280 [Bombiscardovia nodaiensis]
MSNRYLALAALGARPVQIRGLLRSRDTDLMMAAVQNLGAHCWINAHDETFVRIDPPDQGRFKGASEVYCGLAGTVMRFVPALAMLADGPTHFYGDEQAQARPMGPLLDGLHQLGAKIHYQGQEGHLPFVLEPPAGFQGGSVRIDSSSSSQFLSGLLLLGSRAPQGLTVCHEGGPLPSLPHIRMTVSDLQEAGVTIEADEAQAVWRVQPAPEEPYPQLEAQVQVEPDLSNAAPFLGAALVAGGVCAFLTGLRLPLSLAACCRTY